MVNHDSAKQELCNLFCDNPQLHFGSGVNCTYDGEAGTGSVITPTKVDFSSEEKITINCYLNLTEHICTDGAFIPEILECPSISNNSNLIGNKHVERL